jgi:hypothetical protein
MNEVKTLIPISNMSISEISDDELETAFLAVALQHKDAIKSIHQSMIDADNAWQKYTNDDYEPLEDEAKKDRATLNKAEKNIADQYAGLKKAYEKPLENIELNIKSIRGAIKTASGIVDKAVKTYEEKQQGKKHAEIQVYFNGKNFDLVPLEKIFDNRWLNKTYKMADIKKEIDTAVSTIYSNIKTLESIAEHGVIAKACYLETLDMGTAMRQVETLQANAERIAREKIERDERERREQVVRNAAAERQEERVIEKREQMQSLIDEAMEIEPSLPEETKPEIIEYTLRFKGTKEQLLRLREYMTANGITYERIVQEANNE